MKQDGSQARVVPEIAGRPREISGLLAQTPLYSVLRKIQSKGLTGSLSVARPDQSRLLYFNQGELHSARSSVEDHRIGHALVRWGYLSTENLERALHLQEEQGGRLGQLLVREGLLTRAVLDDEARRLMQEIVLSALGWSEGTYTFVPGPRSSDDEIAIGFSLSTTALIIEGIRRVPESEQFLERLGDLANIPRLTRTLAEFDDTVWLPADAAYMLSRIDGRMSIREILSLIPGLEAARAKLLYTLIYCGFVARSVPSRGMPAAVGAPPSVSGNAHRDLVESTYRRIDWFSHYDLLAISRNASAEEIERAYRSRYPLFDPILARQPGLAGLRKQFTVLRSRLALAHEVLSSPTSREAYGRSIERADALPAAIDAGAPGVEKERRNRVRRETASHNVRKAAELVSKKDFFPAIEMLREAVRFVPENAENRRLLAVALMKNPWWRQEAIDHLEKAAALEPGCADTHGRLAKAYLEEGMPEKALPHARTALNVAVDSEKEPHRLMERQVEEALEGSKAVRKRGLARLRGTGKRGRKSKTAR